MIVRILILGAALFATTAVIRQPAGQETPTRRLMRVKRDYAHRLLDAVVQADYQAIREEAFRLKTIAETNDWHAVDTPDYVERSNAFLAATERLYEAAKDEEADAVAIAYMDLTLECVQCHRDLRDRK